MSKSTVKLEVLMGLPGSGKTTFAKSKKGFGVCILHLDDVRAVGNELLFLMACGIVKIHNKLLSPLPGCT